MDPVPPIDVEAAAAAAARPSWRQEIARATVGWAGTAGAGATRRVSWAAALFALGCAAAGLALFAMTLPAADSRLLELGACVPTTLAEMAGLRTASQGLLLAASTQVLAATMGLLVPARLVAVFAYILGWFTADHSTDVLQMLVACHGTTADDDIWSHYRLFRVMLWVFIYEPLVVASLALFGLRR
ncbi:uncharacterized protein [Miscanthus floridulus]|uniref:uncharacterized protein isoform X1 n=2 Tax=Miscanthus floridulus TaxID=154761 RepID=UPI0034592139